MKYIALVCARGGSKGLPGKNIKELGGKPLIGWSIHAANKVRRISKVIVSTESSEIAKVAIEQGADVPFIRPSELAEDNSSEWLVWRHAIEYLRDKKVEFDGLVVLPATAPLRSIEDIENCLNEFENTDADIIISVTEAHRNPYFNMTTNDENGYSSLLMTPENKVVRRQEAPVVYDMTTVAYVVDPIFVLEKNGTFEGRVKSVCIPPERALDIDTPLDFKIAEWLINQRTK
jgi:CMP-N-acetylneuraminic acid synthetase